MFKNQIQKVAVFAWNTVSDALKTGDAANITGDVYIDGGGANAIDDVNPVELGSTGIYMFDLTAVETNGDLIVVVAVSATAGVYIEPIFAYTIFDQTTDAVATVTTVTTTTTNTDMVGTDNAATEAKQDIIDTNVDAILEDTATTLPASIASIPTVGGQPGMRD